MFTVIRHSREETVDKSRAARLTRMTVICIYTQLYVITTLKYVLIRFGHTHLINTSIRVTYYVRKIHPYLIRTLLQIIYYITLDITQFTLPKYSHTNPTRPIDILMPRPRIVLSEV